jgi:hypothetical protein
VDGSITESSLSAKRRAVARASLTPPALRERCHRGLARRLIAVRGSLDRGRSPTSRDGLAVQRAP